MSKSIEIKRSVSEGIKINHNSRRVEGYAIVFNQESGQMYDPEKNRFFREVIRRGAVTEDLIRQSDVICRTGHDPAKVLGRSRNGVGSLTLTVDSYGLKYSFEAPSTAAGDEVLELIRRGDIYGSSFFGAVKREDMVWTRDAKGAKCEITKITMLRDVSPVVFPAYECTEVVVRNKAESDKQVKKCKPLKSIF